MCFWSKHRRSGSEEVFRYGFPGEWRCKRTSDCEDLLKDRPRAAAEGDPAVPVAAPFDRKFSDPKPVPLCAEKHLDIEQETIGNAFPGKHARDIATVHLEAALRVGEFSGDGKHQTQREPEECRGDLAVAVLWDADNAVRQFAGAMCKFALTRFG